MLSRPSLSFSAVTLRSGRETASIRALERELSGAVPPADMAGADFRISFLLLHDFPRLRCAAGAAFRTLRAGKAVAKRLRAMIAATNTRRCRKH